MTDQHTSPGIGGTYFFTLRLADRSGDLLLRRIDCLRRAVRDTRARYPLWIDAVAVLPATLHMLWTLPEGDRDHARRTAYLKSRFSRAMPMPTDRCPAQLRRGGKGIWQRHCWDHLITDPADFARHCDLIHLSPVHAGLCPTPPDWLHSSIHRDVPCAARHLFRQHENRLTSPLGGGLPAQRATPNRIASVGVDP